MTWASIARMSVFQKRFATELITERLCKIFQPHSIYYSQNDHYAHVLGKFLTQELLLRVGLPIHALDTLSRTPKGKWVLPDHDFAFSISHSGDLVACVVSRSGWVGVDIELYRDIDWQTYKDCLSTEDIVMIRSSRNPQHRFLDIWTRKESLLKMWGLGLEIPLSNVIVKEGKGHIMGSTMTGHFLPISIAGYAVSICSSEYQSLNTDLLDFSHWVDQPK